MKVITFVYNSVAKISSFVSIGLLASGIVAGTVACNRENNVTVQHGHEKLASSIANPKVEQIKPEDSGASKALPNSNLSPSLRTLPTGTQAQNVQPYIEQKENAKLRFVNDTPYMSIVYIHTSAKKSYRYAYVPPCTTRELYDTYSNSRLISLNGYAKSPIAKKAKREGDFFMIKMSTLVDDSKQEQLCEVNANEALEINFWDDLGGTVVFGFKKYVGGSDNIAFQRFFSAKDVSFEQASSISNQAFKHVDDKVKLSMARYPEQQTLIVPTLEYNDKLQEAIWLKYLSPNGSTDERYKYLLSSTRLKIESGEIKNADELKNHLNKLKNDPDCIGLYRIFLKNLISVAPKFFDTFAQLSKMKADVRFSPSNQAVKTQPNLPEVKNVKLATNLEKNGQCASTKNNNPIFTLISGHSRPRLQTVLQ